MSNTQHILYSFRRCPYAMRARMGLSTAQIDYEHREVILRDKPAEMLALSPKATVPVLKTKDDQIIDESLDIMLWALKQNDPLNWLGVANLDEMLSVVRLITGDFKTHLDRYKYASRYDETLKRGAVDLHHRAQAVEILQSFENRLADHTYLMGDHVSFADYATFPFIRQFAAVEKAWWDAPALPHIHAWLLELVNSDIFIGIMDKHPQYVAANPQD